VIKVSSDRSIERVDEITGEPPTNKAVDRSMASKLANLLEGIEFPATKEEITRHIKRRQPALGNSVLELVEKNLDNHKKYRDAHEVEKETGLVEETEASKPYVRDRALNKANRKRTGEKTRPDPYAGREKIQPASSRDVSPNTPKGEQV